MFQRRMWFQIYYEKVVPINATPFYGTASLLEAQQLSFLPHYYFPQLHRKSWIQGLDNTFSLRVLGFRNFYIETIIRTIEFTARE